jgi:transposase
MIVSFTQSFKRQAVEKALSQLTGGILSDIAAALCIGQSTLGKWIIKAKHQGFESPSHSRRTGRGIMTNEKRPQDLTLTERLQMVIICGSLDEDDINMMCRQQGIFPHHDAQSRASCGNHQQEPGGQDLQSRDKTLTKSTN